MRGIQSMAAIKIERTSDSSEALYDLEIEGETILKSVTLAEIIKYTHNIHEEESEAK